MLFPCRNLFGIILAAIGLFSPHVGADALKQAINTGLETNRTAAKSQGKIDKLSEQTRKMLDEYRSNTRQTETLQTYNQHLAALLQSQEEEKISLQQQLGEIATTQREIVPLILNMLENLEKFISLDLPFLPEERQNRLTQLKQMVVQADVTNAEKFRRIMEAYQIENDYGNTIEAYRADMQLGEVAGSVDFLRLGRVALYYQRLDGSETGSWNIATKQWDVLPDDYRNAIRDGLRIARKEAAPDMLVVPIPAPEAVE